MTATVAQPTTNVRVTTINRPEPTGLAVDPSGRALLAMPSTGSTGNENGALRTFGSDGQPGPLFRPDVILSPTSVAVAPDGDIVVAERRVAEGAEPASVSRFDPTGTVRRWRTEVGGTFNPQLLVDSDVLAVVIEKDVTYLNPVTGAIQSARALPLYPYAIASLGGGRFATASHTDDAWPLTVFAADGSASSFPVHEGDIPFAIAAAPALGQMVSVESSALCRMSETAARTSCRRSTPSPQGNELLAVGGDGSVWSASRFDSKTTRLTRYDLKQPAAALTAPTNGVVGTSFRLDASASEVALSAVSKFEWDTDGNGTFEMDTGSSGTIDVTPAASGTLAVSVRTTGPTGMTDTATANIKVAAPPPPPPTYPVSPDGPTGVSIDNGQQYTHDPKVTLFVRWPARSLGLFVSNDGGFGNALTAGLAPTLTWTLDSSGPERLPKTVYLRFTGPGAGRETYQDDIILDETPPVIRTATASAGGGAAASIASTKRIAVRLRAKDATSGVAKVQLGTRKSRRLPKVRYRSKLVLAKRARRVYVRVFDAAGNASRWRTVKVRRKR